ncbi:MAG: HNH endonuclease [Eubacteriales bacterium]|nr:HNH endonuclease [Eubacteriales bacterium]
MTEQDIAYVRKCIADHNIHGFYDWGPWKKLRREVLEADRYECQQCKRRGIYRRATTVHHINYVKKHPELALEKYYEWQGKKKRNLISLCHECHEEVHGYRKKKRISPITEERWD